MKTNSNYAVRLPAPLKRAVEKVAREDGTTLDPFIVSALAEKLAVLMTRIILPNALRGPILLALTPDKKARWSSPSTGR